ncbi:phosphatase domain-containing protein [Spongiivirga sp. MCCC 1A20706]|uniref:App1 family protein n=1 Tax=Spongiivirga sp. MCCC 1A20706 TaxID=3160963 RepID=UPI003977DB7C
MPFFKKDPLQIIAFQSYGTKTHFYLRGRALEDEDIDLGKEGFLRLLINSWKRIESDEIKNVVVNVKLPDGIILQATTDNHGYFIAKSSHNDLLALTNEEGWIQTEVSYNDLHNGRKIQLDNRFPAEVLIPSTTARFGVASDIDDTILHTGVVSKLKWKLIVNTFFKSAQKRKSLDGAAEFYHLLHRGKTGKEANPIFYVSHSPWNLYRYLEAFLKQNNFPKGPILLRSFEHFVSRRKRKEGPRKKHEISALLAAYPDLPFILIGDGGEYDLDIYLDIAEQHPGQVRSIYIRSVKHKKKMARIKSLVANYTNIPVLIVDNSKQAIDHARGLGFIK